MSRISTAGWTRMQSALVRVAKAAKATTDSRRDSPEGPAVTSVNSGKLFELLGALADLAEVERYSK